MRKLIKRKRVRLNMEKELIYCSGLLPFWSFAIGKLQITVKINQNRQKNFNNFIMGSVSSFVLRVQDYPNGLVFQVSKDNFFASWSTE